MDDDTLKQLWLNADQQKVEINMEKLIETINLKLSKMDKNIKRRDFQEIFLAAIFIPLFGWWMIASIPLLAKIGSAIIFVNCIIVILKLINARKVKVTEESTSQIKYHLTVSLQRVRNQIKLHSTIFWWYLLPFFCGVICFIYAYVKSIPANIIYTFIVALLYAFIWYGNKKAVRKYMKPLEENIMKAISDLSE
jgi:hypothetical protein